MEKYTEWFADWEGRLITFENPDSMWLLKEKFDENACLYEEGEEDEEEKTQLWPRARAVFDCVKVEGPGPKEAVVKIRMQVPLYYTMEQSPKERAKQARANPDERTELEIETLVELKAANCSSTPLILSWKHTTQPQTLWIPGGFLSYILMTKVPGIPLAGVFKHLPLKERDEVREAFKAAWVDCYKCNLIHDDSGIQNILWDEGNKKCYIVDWEFAYYRTDRERWENYM